MHTNKDKADKCIRLAREFLKEGNREAANKCMRKAVSLNPNLKESFFANACNKSNRNNRNSSSRDSPPVKLNIRSNTTERNFTNADVSVIRNIITFDDLYKILDVSRDSSEGEIRKAYRTLARKLHPDKNSAPGATEAFKKVGSAFEVLLDPEKRSRYDRLGKVDNPGPSFNHYRSSDVFYQFDANYGFDD